MAKRTRKPSDRRQRGAKAKAGKDLAVIYRFRASIAGHVSASAAPVRIVEHAGNKERHAVFNLASLNGSPAFPAAFEAMAKASDAFYEYDYTDNRPTLMDVARDFVQDRLGANWTLSTYVSSCWTPTGWRPPAVPGVGCGAYGLKYRGQSPEVRLFCRAGGTLYMRFAVAVQQVAP